MGDQRRDLACLAALAGAVVLWFLGGELIWTGGHPMFPLDDAFIHLQAAKQTSQFHFLHYFADQGFTPATSSPLWTLLQVPGFWIGLKGVKITLWVWGLSALIYGLTALLLYRIGHTAAGRGAGLLAALLFIGHGHMAWSGLSGMETGLFALLMLVVIHGFQRWDEEGSTGWVKIAWLASALLGFTRPEGFGLTIIAALMITWQAKRGERSGAAAFAWWLATFPCLLWMGALHFLTGSWGPNALAAKGIMADPFWTLSQKLQAVAQNWFDLWGRLYANEGAVIWFLREGSAPWIGPLVLLVAIIGAGPAVMNLAQRRSASGPILAGLWYLLGTGAVCTSAVAFSHHARYFAAYLPLLLLLAALGAKALADILSEKAPNALLGIGVPLVILTVPSLPWWAHTYADNSQDIYEQHRRMSWHLSNRAAVPEDTLVALTDTGLLAYYNEDLPMMDLVGLGTTSLAEGFPRQSTVMRQGLGTLWETLERAPRRPDLIVTYPNLWTSHEHPNLWLGVPTFAAATADLSITFGQSLTAYRPDWSGVDSGAMPVTPLTGSIVDELDVADLMSEEAHGYDWHFAEDRPRHRYHEWPPRFTPLKWMAPNGEPDGPVIWDGGRRMSGGESFTLRVDPGKPLTLIGRTDGHWPTTLHVALDGGTPQVVTIPQVDGWIEFAIQFDAEDVSNAEPRVHIDYQWPRTGESHWSSYHWWAVQPD